MFFPIPVLVQVPVQPGLERSAVAKTTYTGTAKCSEGAKCASTPFIFSASGLTFAASAKPVAAINCQHTVHTVHHYCLKIT